ncbi:hypothetical protein ACFO8O_15680 [Hephaestia sp. GCM10023244]|uniref:hypothetical protein n=1 Tax=unclassified Hephaestia TaxID=2631281 RepID=UPI0020775938|nr:hypothetical protein [Hephaestia sp. MAHUQ-44]MCM8732404.1 hypothetical protein [Hephaestia sp. MAHUQ-44]
MAVFNLLYVASCLFAMARGGAPERVGAGILILDFQLSHWLIAPLGAGRYLGVEWPMFGVDFGAFLALYALSLLSTRYWPIWMAAVQGCVALSHLAGLSPAVVPWAYGNFVALWAYALLAILGVATWRHRRRQRRFGIDPAWRSQLPSFYRKGGRADDPKFRPSDQRAP